MTDIVERLRDRARGYRIGGPSSEHTAVMLETAADEIERLRAALSYYACEGDCKNCRGEFPDFVCGQRARAALGGENG